MIGHSLGRMESSIKKFTAHLYLQVLHLTVELPFANLIRLIM